MHVLFRDGGCQHSPREGIVTLQRANYYRRPICMFSTIWNISCGDGIRPDSSFDQMGTSAQNRCIWIFPARYFVPTHREVSPQDDYVTKWIIISIIANIELNVTQIRLNICGSYALIWLQEDTTPMAIVVLNCTYYVSIISGAYHCMKFQKLQWKSFALLWHCWWRKASNRHTSEKRRRKRHEKSRSHASYSNRIFYFLLILLFT